MFRPYPSQRIIPRGNVAAVEPYIHTPQQKTTTTTTSNLGDLKKQHQEPKQHQQQLIQDLTNLKLNLLHSNQNITNNNMNLSVNHMNIPESDETKLARQKLHMKQHSQDLDNEYVSDFNAKKTDPKYQTLPYNTKFGLNKSASSGMIPIPSYSSSLLKKVMQKSNSNESDSAKSSETDSSAPHGTKLQSNSQNSHQQLTVHSTPLNTINRSVAIPISNSTPATSSVASVTPTVTSNNHHHGGNERTSLKSKGKSLQIPSGNLVVPPRKPISSVAPTTVSLGPKSTVQSPKVHMVAPSINTTPIMSAMENDKSRPALPPKPNKNGSDSDSSPTSTITSSAIPANTTSNNHNNNKIHKSNSVSSVPTVVSVINKAAMSEPNSMLSSTATTTTTQHTTQSILMSQDVNQISTILSSNIVDNLPIKAKPLTIKKQPLSEQPRLRTMTSGIKPIQYTSRRIEMPPAFLFPEIEKGVLKSDTSVKTSPSTTTTQAAAIPTPSPIINTTVVDSNTQSPSGSSIDETDKSTSSSMSCDDKMTVQNDILRRTRSALTENGKVKLARRVSFDPLALLLDASLEGELELVQKTAMQVN